MCGCSPIERFTGGSEVLRTQPIGDEAVFLAVAGTIAPEAEASHERVRSVVRLVHDRHQARELALSKAIGDGGTGRLVSVAPAPEFRSDRDHRLGLPRQTLVEDSRRLRGPKPDEADQVAGSR